MLHIKKMQPYKYYLLHYKLSNFKDLPNGCGTNNHIECDHKSASACESCTDPKSNKGYPDHKFSEFQQSHAAS